VKRKLTPIYVRRVIRNERLAGVFQFKQPTVLLLSYPRSGSSWIGKMLSVSPDFAYMREPVTHAVFDKLEGKTLVDPYQNEMLLPHYIEAADQVFAGIPPQLEPNIVDNLADFFPPTRPRRRLLVKAVNPVATEFYVQRYAPRVVFILRHPAAIADSFSRMGWHVGDWETFGFTYGSRMNRALKVCRPMPCEIVRYEDVAADPLNQFRALYDRLGARVSADFEQMVAEYSSGQTRGNNPYRIRRTSSAEIDKWRNNLSQSAIDAIMRGYARSGLNDY
jgi:hypothetical protein